MQLARKNSKREDKKRRAGLERQLRQQGEKERAANQAKAEDKRESATMTTARSRKEGAMHQRLPPVPELVG